MMTTVLAIGAAILIAISVVMMFAMVGMLFWLMIGDVRDIRAERAKRKEAE